VDDEPGSDAFLSAIRAGDRRAFARAVSVYERSVRRFASAFLGDAAEGDDVAQRAFLDLWNDRAKLRPEGSLRGLLLARARHLCLNRARALGRARVRGESLAAEPVQADAPPTPLDALVGAQDSRDAGALHARVLALVAELDDDVRTAIWMRFAGEASFEEIAEAIGRPPHAMRALVYRALAGIRGKLGGAS